MRRVPKIMKLATAAIGLFGFTGFSSVLAMFEG
jgi:hypothetical protein